MKIKLIAVVVLIVFGIGVAFYTVSSIVSTKNDYKSLIAKAQKNADRNIPYVAMINYDKAFAIETPDEELFCKYLNEMEKLGEDYYDEAIEKYLNMFPMSSNAYELYLDRLFEAENYKLVVQYALEAKEKNIATEKIQNYYIESVYKYKYLKIGFAEATSFLGNNAVIQKDELYGNLSIDGDYFVAPYYEKLSFFMGGAAAAFDGKEWFMINELGFVVARPDKPLDELSFESNGYLLAKKGNKYTYLTRDLIVPETFMYDDATNFKSGIAGVKQNGKWALVNTSGKNVTDYIFEDIIRDEYNSIINNDVIFAKQSGKYYMFDKSGKKISETAFDDAHPFVSDQPAAVKINDKWGFVDKTGNIVIEPKYDDAYSYCCNLAPVCNGELWNYISSNETVRIQGDFQGAKSFTTSGIAAIKEGEVWNYIRLLTYAD